MSIIVIVRHIFALLSLVWHRYHFGTIFRTLWGSKHSFHGNITDTHIDKRIGAAVFLWWRMKPQKLRGFQLVNTIKRCQYIRGGKRDPRISRGICLISHHEVRQITNDSYLLFAKSTLWLCLSACQRVCLCLWEQLQMGNNFQLDFTLQMDILIRCSCSHQAGEKQSGTV